MSKIHSMMDIGRRSMSNNQTALQTVAHNIANKTTEGYSRQRVDVTTAPSVTEGKLQLGMGSRAASVTRVNNPFLDRQLQKETGQLGYLDGQAEALGRVEQVFNEQINKGLNQYISEFFNAFRELSNNPESVTTRTMVRESAVALAGDFTRVHKQLEQVQEEIDMQVRHNVEEINKMSTEIATLNEKIAQVEIQGVHSNDERDRRDVLIKKLNEKIDVKVAETDNGMLTISTAGNAILVSGLEAMQLSSAVDPDTNRTQVYYQNSGAPPFNITDRIKGGQVGGALQVRDKLVPETQERIDELAYTLANEVNSVHTQGYDRAGRQGGVFFEIPTSQDQAASEIKVSDEVLNDVTRISAAAHPNAPADNTAANIISMIQFREIMDGGTSTLDDYYNSQVGRLGVVVDRANKSRDAQDNIVKQVNTLRESVSGVSLDEEATKMIEFQKAFEASARVIRTADEMFDTVLSLKRM